MSEQKRIPFDLEKFKAGMKAKWGKQLIKYTYTATNGFICFEFEDGDPSYSALEHLIKAATMVSRHQALIDSYDPEDTWQFNVKTYDEWFDIKGKPEWEEGREFRLHPHNDLIKAYRKGAKIKRLESGGYLVDDHNPTWDEHKVYHIKPETTIHCLCYNPGHVHGEFSWSPCLATKELAVANGWKIIQEWEV